MNRFPVPFTSRITRIFLIYRSAALTAEEQVEKWVDGRKKILWDSKKRRNEASTASFMRWRRCASVFPAGSWISVPAGEPAGRGCAQPTRKHWQITPVPYPRG
ncbi:hypothetical protein EC180200_5078 [Escherichia coli 180200]|nr:hypothetical protein EC180200_5078 [Escherichia coli 180200]